MARKSRLLTENMVYKAVSMGAGLMFDFEGFRLVEGTDSKMRARYIVLSSKDGSPVTEYDPDNTYCIELDLSEFHQLCAFYLSSLQSDMGHAKDILRDELNSLLTRVRFERLVKGVQLDQ